MIYSLLLDIPSSFADICDCMDLICFYGAYFAMVCNKCYEIIDCLLLSDLLLLLKAIQYTLYHICYMSTYKN